MLGKLKYAISEIAENGHDPYWWRQRFLARVVGPSLGALYRNPGEDFIERDWDNLLILDACRADMFEEAIDIDQFDSYERVHSVGCSSPEWMRKTFQDAEYPDTVYVTANPWISREAPDSFHEIINIWTLKHNLTDEEISDAMTLADTDLEDVSTIYAEEVNKHAKEARERFPDKRLIVHYFQPHAPCIGNPDGTPKEAYQEKYHPGDDLWNGNVTREEVWDQYLDNLHYVFHHAKLLAEELGGKSVFTADHGELFGDWLFPFPMRGYAHPSGVRHPKLTEVPWAELTVGERRDIVAGELSTHEADEDVIDERLRDLGYKV
jgi:hypothetical protein